MQVNSYSPRARAASHEINHTEGNVSRRDLKGSRRAFVTSATCLAVGALIAAGCGSSGKASSSSGGSTVPSSGGSKTLSVLTIEVNPSPAIDTTLGTQAAIDAINAAGGVDGYKLNYIFCSNGTPITGDPNAVASCAAEAVQKHVVALVGTFDGYDNAAYPYLNSAHIANIGEQPDAVADATDAESYAMVDSDAELAAGEGYQLAHAGCKTASVMVEQGLPIDSEEEQYFAAGVKLGGGTAASPVQVSSSNLDLAPIFAQLKSQGVTCVGESLPSGPVLVPLVEAAEGTPGMTLSVNAATLTGADLKALGNKGNGVLGVSTAIDGAITSDTNLQNATPQEKQMIANITKYGGSLGVSGGALEWIGYNSVEVLKQAIAKVVSEKKTVDAASITDALNTITVNNGIYPSMNFSNKGVLPNAPRLFNTYVNTFKLENGKIVPTTTAAVNLAPAFKS